MYFLASNPSSSHLKHLRDWSEFRVCSANIIKHTLRERKDLLKIPHFKLHLDPQIMKRHPSSSAIAFYQW